MYKKEIRVIGIDDSPFNKFGRGNVLVMGVIFRGGSWLDGVLSTKVRVDGNNATKRLTEMINKCKFKPQLQCIFLDGIALGGFNIVDIQQLNKKFKERIVGQMIRAKENGEWSKAQGYDKNELEELVNKLDSRLLKAAENSDLPEKPNIPAINKYLKDLRVEDLI